MPEKKLCPVLSLLEADSQSFVANSKGLVMSGKFHHSRFTFSKAEVVNKTFAIIMMAADKESIATTVNDYLIQKNERLQKRSFACCLHTAHPPTFVAYIVFA